jgi:hypothetical protein
MTLASSPQSLIFLLCFCYTAFALILESPFRYNLNSFSKSHQIHCSRAGWNLNFFPEQVTQKYSLFKRARNISNLIENNHFHSRRSAIVDGFVFIFSTISASQRASASNLPSSSLEVLGQSEYSSPLLSIFKFSENSFTPISSFFSKSIRPPPMRIPRTSLYRPFAVLLMRSSYEAADDLDFVPMDRFQKDFFLLRADEWEMYRSEHDVRQGDLSETAYFDFISAAQYATISKLMRETPSRVFEERVGADGETRVVQRNPLVSDTALPALLLERAGDRILEGLFQNFTGPNFYTQPPQPCRDWECLVKALVQLCVLL